MSINSLSLFVPGGDVRVKSGRRSWLEFGPVVSVWPAMHRYQFLSRSYTVESAPKIHMAVGHRHHSVFGKTHVIHTRRQEISNTFDTILPGGNGQLVSGVQGRFCHQNSPKYHIGCSWDTLCASVYVRTRVANRWSIVHGCTRVWKLRETARVRRWGTTPLRDDFSLNVCT